MGHEDAGSAPGGGGALVRRAYEFLDALGRPAAEEEVITHLFGAHGNINLWKVLLRQTLRGSTLFEETGESGFAGEVFWSLASWGKKTRSLSAVDFVIVDTETTGVRPGPDRVIEVGAVRVRNGHIVDSYQSLINPRRSIPPFIARFTGITPEMVQDAPTMDVVMPDLLSFLDNAVLVGHNVSFDLRFLSHEAELLGYAFPLDGFDTITLSRRFLPGLKRFKLDMVAAHLRIQTRNRHRALGDAEVTAEVFLHILKLAQGQGIDSLARLQRRVQLPVAWSGDPTQLDVTPAEPWRGDAPLSPTASAHSRPNGGLFLNPAWKRTFPTQPGVYLMRDAHDNVIYVGKAKCLKDRLSSYYSQPLGYTRKMDGLLQNVKEIETRVLGSELEALLVESRLIKELQPMYNVQLRNYELYPFIKIDVQHAFPRVYATREVSSDGARYFGPFRSRRMVDLTIELVQKIFPVRTCTRALPPQAKPSAPCLRLHLGRCSAPCQGDADAEAYRLVISEVCAFLGGEREDLLDRLRRQMLEASQNLNFERAAWLRDVVRSAEEVLLGQRLITGAVESNNLFIIYPSSETGHNEIFLIRHGRLVMQRRVPHDSSLMRATLSELIAYAASLGEAPAVVGKAEVDQINIISRWIHHHSQDQVRAFFPFAHSLADEQAIHELIEHILTAVDAGYQLALESAEEDEATPELFLSPIPADHDAL